MVSTVFASYNGSQLGFTVRNLQLVQLSAVGTGHNFRSISAGPNNDVYMTSANHIYHYSAAGALITDMTFPDAGISYTGVSATADHVYACYAGSQLGVTVRDLNLNQQSFFATGLHANGIAAGQNNDVYVVAGNHIYNYAANGTLIRNMTFPDTGINYTDVSVYGGLVYASYSGSQHGFTIRDLALNQLSFASLAINISSIAAGPRGDVYLASANHLYNYAPNGTLITNMTFPSNTINYSGISLSISTIT